VFIVAGERRSRRAREMGVRWNDGHLATKSLFDALRASGIDPEGQIYIQPCSTSAACAYGPARASYRGYHGCARSDGSSPWAAGCM
jgi:hypothetical protein